MLYPREVIEWITEHDYEYKAIVLSVLGIGLVIFYLYHRQVLHEVRKIVRSLRFDLLLAVFFGIWVSVTWNIFSDARFIQLVETLSVSQLLIILLAPFLLGLLVLFRWIFWQSKDTPSTLIVDNELDATDKDLLNFSKKAERFAERVYNNGASESLVFGVDAPWGIGKSTFINFCKEYWEKTYDSKVVVYKFNPLKHVGAKHLLEIFINGLIEAIQKDSFIPEIRPLITKYARLLREVHRFSIFGISIPSFSWDYTAEDAEDDLCAVLKRFPKKVIIVVDDLDRLEFNEIKDILFVIRKSFVFPNISYVLCYDTENIGALEAETPETEKVSEFFEKFVNVKISIYLNREELSKYVSESLNEVLPSTFTDPFLIQQATGGLLDIYKSSRYHNYLPFIGDVRKLKRFINTVITFELQTADFKNSDFNKQDLSNLLLIYIHYPNIFRKIYDTETRGGRGFFSLVVPYDDGYYSENEQRKYAEKSSYRNSIYYKEYTKKLGEDSRQVFLLNQIFNVDVRLKDLLGESSHTTDYTLIDGVSEDLRTSLACFNGGWTNGRNLEAYLDLIVDLAKPVETEQHRFYVNQRDLIADGTKFPEILAKVQFGILNGEDPHTKLWRIVVNSARKLQPQIAQHVINQLLEMMPRYSTLELEIGLGLRHNLALSLTRLLNEAGWTDGSNNRSYNTEENIKEAAEWVFGEGAHVGEGVIDKLSDASRGVLGLNDLMYFRLFCSADRGGDIFNLTRALSKHGNKSAPTNGNTGEIAREEMREISQKVFKIFETQYIQQNRNIFREIATLTVEQLAGDFMPYLEKKITEGVITQEILERKVFELKTRIASFITFQLGNSEISLGVGCGFYDPTGGKDEHGIRKIISNYLIDVCFRPITSDNAQDFIDYLFRNFVSVIAESREDGRKYIPSITQFTKVIDKPKLAAFWKQHSEAYRNFGLEQLDKVVFLGEHEATYKEYIPIIYQVLDTNNTQVAKEEFEAQEAAKIEKAKKPEDCTNKEVGVTLKN